MNSIILDLKPIIEGEVSSTEEDLAAVSQDFGGIVQKRPQVVVRPQNSADVAEAVKYASAHGLTISSRAAGHSLSGQSLNQNGILLDMRSLCQIDEICSDQWFQADAGTTWKQVVNASLPQGAIPPVLTNYFDVTIGGTHSAGGLGQSSFRYGSQADNCLGLEVVTTTGELVWCTPEQNNELFYHVLCGYGQFGIITKVQHRLRPCRPFTRTYFLCYDNLDSFLNDERFLVEQNRIDGLLALFSPCILGVTRTQGNSIRPLVEWFYRMQITLELDSVDDIDEAELLSSLNFYRHIYTEDLTFEQFIQPSIQVPHLTGVANPWIDVLLPGSVAQDYIEIALEQVPSFIDFRATPIGSFCLTSRNITVPMFPLPKEELIVGFGMYPTIPQSQLSRVVEQLNLLTEIAFQMGGKRYVASWADFDLPKWRLQYGDYWTKVNEMKRKYDPQGIFNPGFFCYKEANQQTPAKVSTKVIQSAM